MVAVEIDAELARKYIKTDLLKNYIELEKCPTDIVRIFGNVVRCDQSPDGSFDVAIHLCNK